MKDFEYDLKCPKIDVHWHVGSWNVCEERLKSSEASHDFDRYGYKFILVNSIKAIMYDLASGNAETAEFIKKDKRCRGLVVVHPTKPEESLKEIAKYRKNPQFVGLKTAADYYSTTLADPRYGRILETANALGCVILTHKYDLDLVAPQYPNIKFIAAHSMVADVKKLAKFPNIVFDICASYTHREETNLEEMVALAGDDRVIYATDAQLMKPAWSIGKISSAALTRQQKDKIFYGNAFRLLNGFKTNPFVDSKVSLNEGKAMNTAFFLKGKNISLRKLTMDDAKESYLQWLNDPDVLRYRGPKAYPSNMDDLRDFIKHAQGSKDLFLAICLNKGGKHIGGISLTSLNLIHRSAELSIMIGDKAEWGKNYGAEAIQLLARHGFMNLNLNKIWAESPSPAFNKTMRKLGWTHEGTKRKMFLLDGDYIDVECFGLLKSEYKR